MAESTFWRGTHSVIIFSFQEKKLVIDITDWEVTREGEEIEDDICGNDRALLGFETSHFSVMLNAKQRKMEAVDAFIEEQKAKDARAIAKQNSVGFIIKPLDGTLQSYQARDY